MLRNYLNKTCNLVTLDLLLGLGGKKIANDNF